VPAVRWLELLVGLVLLLGLGLLVMSLRRRVLQRGGGTIDLSLRLKTRSRGRGWVLGVGKFVDDELHWFRVFSLSLRPRRRLSRRTLEVVERRPPTGPEVFALLKGAVVLECRDGAGPVQIALDAQAVTGFMAWLESRPPGVRLHL
jgi:hypothetical protein